MTPSAPDTAATSLGTAIGTDSLAGTAGDGAEEGGALLAGAELCGDELAATVAWVLVAATGTCGDDAPTYLWITRNAAPPANAAAIATPNTTSTAERLDERRPAVAATGVAGETGGRMGVPATWGEGVAAGGAPT